MNSTLNDTLRKRAFTLLAAAIAVAGFAHASDGATQHDAPVGLDLTFVFHVDDDLAEQDVYIERVPGSGEVFRPTKAERQLDQPLYAAAAEVEHAPFEPDALGPFPRGKALGMTLREWFAASGKGRYECVDGTGTVTVDFERLAPDATYTFWHTFFAWPPTEPFIGTYDLPLGARDGSESVFRTDADGSARYERTFTPCLQLGGEHLLSDVAISLHSDGQVHGHHPGPFGYTSHVQLYAALPKRAGL